MGSFIAVPSRCIPRDVSWSRYAARAPAAPLLGFPLERPLPEEFPLAAVMADPPGEDEEQVGEPVQVGERPLAYVLAPHETQHVPFRAPAHGPGHVEECAHAPAARKHEGPERLQVLLATVHRRLERLHLRGTDAEHPRPELRRRRRELPAQVEELVLEPPEDRVELPRRPRAPRLRGVHGAHHADGRVQLVHRPVGLDPGAVLRDPRSPDEVRLALVAAARVDACQPDRHRGPQTRWKSESTPAGCAGIRATAAFSATCSRRLIPTSAAVTPGVERTNWIARCAGVSSPGKASASACGRRRESWPWRIDALAIA